MKTKARKRSCTVAIALAAGFLFVEVAVVPAAQIAYVGVQVNIDDRTDTPTDGWRNVAPPKPLDIDGNNVLGSDGWWLHQTQSAPSYASVTEVGSRFGGAYGVWDDPADPSGTDTIGGGIFRDSGYSATNTLSSPLLQFEVTGTDLAGMILRIGVLCDVIGDASTISSPGIATYTVMQTSGVGSNSVTSAALTYTGESMDAAYFDIEEAVAGDTFIVQTTIVQAPGWPNISFQQFAGFTFDSVPGPPKGTLLIVK